jgi:hypothetical protein
MLQQEINTLRADGYAPSDVELWGIGFPGTGTSVTTYAGSADSACFEASVDMVFDPVLDWNKDDLWLVDRAGLAWRWGNLGAQPLPGSLASIDAAIRARL